MKASTAKSGAVMQAPTTSADNAPSTATAANFPPERPADAFDTPSCQRCGRNDIEAGNQRERENRQQDGERAEHPRVLQPRAKALTDERRSNPECGVDERHAKHV